ncbi:MAG: hypothetical protein IKS90_01495 [Clostridia bacterium]|nr:hypothetical protein [Clostridia bacterium]
MGYKKCPKCELNYIRDDQKFCDICARKYKDVDEDEAQDIVLCSECGENPVLKGKDLCSACYKESLRQEQFAKQHKPPVVTSIGVEETDYDDVEMAIDEGEIPEDELTKVEKAFDDDDLDIDEGDAEDELRDEDY